MPEVVGAFLSTELWNERRPGGVQSTSPPLVRLIFTRRQQAALDHTSEEQVARLIIQEKNKPPSLQITNEEQAMSTNSLGPHVEGGG